MDETDGRSPVNDADRLRKFLYNSIKKGCYSMMRFWFGEKIDDGDYAEKIDNIVNEPHEGGVTALHIAADYGNYEDMKILLEDGAKVIRDNNDSTPLHLVALSTEPNPMTARLLIKYMKRQNAENTEQRYRLINAPTRSSGEQSYGKLATRHCILPLITNTCRVSLFRLWKWKALTRALGIQREKLPFI